MTAVQDQPETGLLIDASTGQAEPWTSWDLSTAAAPPPFRGAVERIDTEGVGGWCVAFAPEGQPAYLALRLAGIDLAVSEAALARPDVAAAAGVAGPCGFLIPWTDVQYRALTPAHLSQLRSLPPETVAPVEIWVADQQLRLGWVPGGHFSLTAGELLALIQDQEAMEATPPGYPEQETGVRGALDGMEAGTLFGWAQRTDDPAPVTVALCVDGTVVATAVADGARVDLEALGIGAAAYSLAVPAQCHDGGAHRLEVRTLPDGVLLAGGSLQATLSAIEDGAWWVAGGALEGWVLPAIDGPLELRPQVDGVSRDQITLEGERGVPARLRWPLPQALSDGSTHMLGLECRSEPGRLLRHVDGGTSWRCRRRIRASIDVVADGRIQGWAYALDAPDISIELAFHEGDRRLAVYRADGPRPDVNGAFAIRGDHGFAIALPATLLDRRPRALRLIADGEELPLPDCLLDMDGPWPPPELLPGGQRHGGAVDHIDGQGLSGWAIDRLAPDRPVRVAILLDGTCVGTVLADGFEKRLQPVGGSGYHGFRFAFPATVMNGAWRRIEVTIAGSDTRLPIGGPNLHLDRFFPLIDFLPVIAGPGQAEAVEQRLRYSMARPQPAPLPADDEVLVSLIVLNWNGAALLEPFLRSVLAWLPVDRLEIVLVDHGSTDDSLDVVRGFEGRLRIQVLARDGNYSFAASNNLAAEKARGRHLFFVNNDILFTGNVLPGLVAWLEQQPTVGAVGMRLLEPLPAAGGGWRLAPHHHGIRFKAGRSADLAAYVPVELDDDAGEMGAAFLLPAVTAAAMLCRAADFRAVGGFDEGYFYGLEDVDLCLRLLMMRGLRSVCDTTLVAIHHRSVTRTARLEVTGQPNPVTRDPDSQKRNHHLFQTRFRRRLTRTILTDLLQGGTQWRQVPLRVVLLVTDAGWDTPAGDFYTALELATALRDAFGWEVMFARQGAASVPGADILIAMRHDTDVRRLSDANPGAITVGWIRNRVDEWLAAAHLDAFHLLFCSSAKAVEAVRAETGRTPTLLPIATNPDRFRPQPPAQAGTILFTGNYWGVPRGGLDLLTDPDLLARLRIYGHGWSAHSHWRRYWRRPAGYRELPKIYGEAAIVIDDGHPVTRDWNSLNSRVFDALAAGRLVVTNSREGADALFGGLLPTFADEAELNALCRRHLEDPAARKQLVAQLREHVLNHHTYAHRARTLQATLLAWTQRSLRIAIKIGVPDAAEREQWGDWHFARALARALSRAGHHARVDLLPDWYQPLAASDDVVITLRGLSIYEPAPHQINLMWMISHPDKVDAGEMAAYDHVFVASAPYAEKLRAGLGERVSALLQCTDPALFHPGPDPADGTGDILFVGNSRGVRRPAVDAAIEAGIDLAVHGSGWDGVIDDRFLRGTYIPNHELGSHYAAARIVLNDHWPDMRREGFLSNRLFDAAASGAVILSDNVAGLADIFGNGIETFTDAADFTGTLRRMLAEPAALRARAEALSRHVAAHHSFDNRAAQILARVATIGR
ncbi:glycosyltransferase family protein [Niveispirillum sp. KHB5.9]|uniref:glycosyltransferase family protein n=1 Tax=Niveispirillum sp. KHB5.9 TaxID=3400269 RepID=UPI003A853AB0